MLVSCSDERSRAHQALQKKGIALAAEQVARAVERNDASSLDQLLTCAVFPDQCNAQGRTPLLIAISQGDYGSAIRLLNAGANANAINFDLSSPLATAAQKADIPAAKALLARNANPNVKANVETSNSEPLLLWCMKNGRYVIARELLDHGADPHLTDRTGLSPLACAIDKKQRALALLLLEKGADPGKFSKEPSQETPIVIRCLAQGWSDMIPMLVKKGADLNAVNANGQMAVDISLANGDVTQFQKLIQLGADVGLGGWDTRLWQAVERSDIKTLTTILDAGIKTDKSNDKQQTLLSAAIAKSDHAVMEILLKKQPLQQDALHLACAKGDLIATQLLHKYGCDVNALFAPTQDIPINVAIRSNNPAVLQYLLDNGATIDHKGIENQTPLACAIANKKKEMVKILLDKGADTNQKLETAANDIFLSFIDGNGMKFYLRKDRNITPLMLAADSGSLEITKLLLDHGAKINVWTAVNKTWPLNFASRKSDVPMMRLLMGKDPLVEDRKIVVSLKEQKAKLFSATGEIIYTTKISSGKKGFDTPTGTYVITNKHKEWHSTIYDSASMPCFQRLSCSDFGFHQGVVPGYAASHGCIRVPAGNAQKLFGLTQLGDRVVIE
jgi:ankyrin repeat protein